VRDLLYPGHQLYAFDKSELVGIHTDGWGSQDPNFRTVLEEVKPRLVIEVGSWLGDSAIHMSSLLESLVPWYEIVCVDTWLGATEMWTDTADATRYRMLGLDDGYPTIYRQFLRNVWLSGYASKITPFPQTSANAARWFKKKGILADAIYLDASHEYEDVLLDLKLYFPLVRDGGILFGDDWQTFRDVAQALDNYGRPWTKAGRQWVIRS